MYQEEILSSMGSGTIEREQADFIIASAKKGDQHLLGKLFQAHRRKLIHFVRSKVSRPSDIDDLVQETFLQAQKSIANYEGKAAFSTWILGIALNLVRNHYNRLPEFRYQFCSDDDLTHACADYGIPEESAQQEDRITQLQYHIDQLPCQSRKIVLMVAIDGLSYDEVARRLNMTVSTVKSRLFRARQQLRDHLRPFL